MIKKIFKGLLTFGIIGLGLLNICSSAWILRNNGDYGYSTIDDSLNLNVVNKGQLMTQRFGQTQRMLAFTSFERSRIYFFRSYNQRPYYFVQYKGSFYQGFLKYYYICDYFTGESIGGNCVKHDITDNFAVEIGGFFDSITINDMWGYDIHTWDCYGGKQVVNKVAFGSSTFNKVIVFSAGSDVYPGGCADTDGHALQGTLGILSGTDFTFINPSYLNNPPGMTNIVRTGSENIDGGNSISQNQDLTGDLIISEVTTGDVINYIQSADGFKPSICYVGTTDLNSPYGTRGISFEEGTGATIFDLYYDKFGVWSGASHGLQYVANMIDARTINYYGWFLTNGNPGYQGLADFNGQIYDRIYDTGSGFTFPFANKPVAYYFMANNVRNYSNYYGNSSHLIGSRVVDYCNMLLNGSTMDDMISSGLKSDILGNFNRNLATSENVYNWYLNLDGYTGSEWKADGSSWSGVFESSVVITDGVNFINTFFNTVKNNFQLPNKNGGQNGIIPSYILVALFALILFRLISH